MGVNYDSFLLARQKLLDTISIPDYYMDYVDESKNLEVYNKDCCPLHDESSPSFFYVEEKNMFHCFGCGKSGGVTELHYFIQKRNDESYTKIRAVRDLAKLYNVEIPNIFKAADLKENSRFGKSTKLAFKPKEELVKPRKKVESDFSSDVLRNRELLGNGVVKSLLDEMDEIYFREVDVVGEMEELQTKFKSLLSRE